MAACISTNRGEEWKTFSSLDGHGIRMLLDAASTSPSSPAASPASSNTACAISASNTFTRATATSSPAFDKLLREPGLEASKVAYVGDDLPDLPIMRGVGFSVAVQNAHGFVKQHCDLVTSASGGHGAVREITDFILHGPGLARRPAKQLSRSEVSQLLAFVVVIGLMAIAAGLDYESRLREPSRIAAALRNTRQHRLLHDQPELSRGRCRRPSRLRIHQHPARTPASSTTSATSSCRRCASTARRRLAPSTRATGVCGMPTTCYGCASRW